MVTSRFVVVCVGLCLALGCGSSSAPAVEPDTEEFEIPPADQMALDDASDNGLGAEGSYSYDEQGDRLTITITVSDFGCGPTTGTFVAIVTELTATTMVWEFEGEDGGVTWTRVDTGTSGVVGVWKTDDPSLYLILSADGSAQLFGMDDMCDDDRPRNGDNCVQLNLNGLDISIDGDLSDWDNISQDAAVFDEQNDYLGGDGGADLRAMKVEYGNGALNVLMLLHGGPSTAFQDSQPPNSGVYRLTVRGDNGLSLYERVMYRPDLQSWVTAGDAAEVSVAAGDEGFEFRVDVSSFEGAGFESIDLIMVEPMSCETGTCETLDTIDCGYINVPM